MPETARLALVLTLICGICAGLLSITREGLGKRIEQQEDFYIRGPAVERLLQEPAGQLLNNKITFRDDTGSYPILYRKGEDGVEALAVEAHGPGGYGGDIVLMTGIDLKTDELTGLEIIQHSETPGVGSRVEGEEFRRQWRGLSTSKPLTLDEIDAVTGATYSSKAVVAGTNAVIDLYRQHKDEILRAIEEEKK